MDSDKNSDSSDFNAWKLCYKSDSFTFSETSSEFQYLFRVSSSLNGVSDSQTSSRTSRDSQIRCINPAIYVEPLNIENSELSQDEYQLKNVGSADFLHTGLSNIHINGNPNPCFNTYRCESLISSKPSITSSTNKSKSLSRIERRCKIDDQSVNSINPDQPEVQRYSVNGNKIIKVSTSLSNCILSRHDSSTSLTKKQVYDEWMRKKNNYIIEKKKKSEEFELNKKLEEERLKREKEEKEKLKQENFLMWLEKKNAEDAYKRMIIQKELELKRKIEEFEAKTIVVKELCLKKWYCKKERERKEQKRKEKLKMKKLEEERQKKLEESSKAFEIWLEKSKNKPLPATQGLLPHQQAKPAYINPIPWVVDDISTEIEQDSILNN